MRRLGSTRSEPVDVWLISATNTDLNAAIVARRFRDDLYHRLAVVTLDLPPLRERGHDILLLAGRILARVVEEMDCRPSAFMRTRRPVCSAMRGRATSGNSAMSSSARSCSATRPK